MRKCILAVFSFLAAIPISRAQCPNVSFSIPDSACAGDLFTVTNTSSGTGNFSWDACTGDLLGTASFYGSNNSSLGYPQQIKAIKENNKYYLFIANQNQNNIMKYDFGNSWSNFPVVFNYGNFGNVLANPYGMDMVKENGIWYAIASNNNNQHLIRIDFGTDLDANSATATDLGTSGTSGAGRVKIVKESNNNSVFISALSLERVDFGNSITNTPMTAVPIIGNFIYNGIGFDVIYDCAQNKYFGYFATNTSNLVQIIDFGSSTTTTNTPAYPATFPIPSGTVSIKVVKDGSNWHMLTMNSVGGGHHQNFLFGPDPASVPVNLYDDAIAGITNPQFLSVFQDSSRTYCFVSTVFPNTITSFVYESPCTQNPGFSTDPVSFQITAGSGGYQSVTLKLTDSSGFTNSITDSIFVNPLPSSFFTTGTACENNLTQFTDATTIAVGNVSTWEWDFGDGSPLSNQQNPDHLFQNSGDYTVSLTTQSSPSCPSDTYTTQVTINPLPSVAFSFTNPQCQGYEVAFIDNSQASGGTTLQSWLWDFGDGSAAETMQNPVHTYDSTGAFNVNLVVTTDAGCIDSTNSSINIVPTPVALFTVSSTCVGETVAFTNSSTIDGGGNISYTWDFGDASSSMATNPTHQYLAAAGNYNVSLIATSVNGCQDTLITDLRIANKPIPQFSWTPQIVCRGNQVTFSNTSLGSGGDTIASFVWNFGDSGMSTAEDPFHAYADTGLYTVTLTAISPTDCDSTVTHQVYVIPSPEGTFTAAGVCLNLATSFNPFITTPPGTQVDSVVWDFGDGTTFTGISSPSHTYLMPGRYQVTMTIYNDLLCTGSFVDSVEVYPLPVPAFTSSLSCSGAPVEFDGSLSSVTGDTLSSWLWNFAGLGISTDTIPQFTFNTAGNYNVTLVTYTSHGCYDTLTQLINVIQSPDFTINFTEPCFGNPSSFTYVSNIIPVPPSNLLWDFGDGTLSSLLSPTHIYSAAGNYNVLLTVVNPATGCSASYSDQLFIKPLPQPGFLVSGVCEDNPFQFTDTSVIQTGSVTGWSWNFGPLGTSNVQNPSVTPSAAGNIQVMLTVTSNEGCSASTSGNVSVAPRPTAAFTPSPLYGSPPLTVNFTNNTTGGSNYLWDFGDGASGSGITPSHLYADTGTYQVTMTAVSNLGCTDVANGYVAVLIPYIDVAVNNVFAALDGSNLRLSAQIANLGNVVLTRFDVKGTIDNGSTISEKWTGNLAPGQVILYNFQSSYEVSDSYDITYFCVETAKPNDTTDQNLSNNRKCATASANFEIFSVYPNPFDDFVNINFNLKTEGLFRVEIFDETGKLVFRGPETKGLKGFNRTVADTHALSQGSYSLRIQFRDDVKSIKAVKLRR